MQTRPSLSIKATSPLLSQSVDWRGSQSGLASPPSGLGVPSVHGDPAGESDETHVSGKAGAGEKPRSIPAFYVRPFIGGGAGKVPFGERSRFHHCSWWLTRWSTRWSTRWLTRWPTRSTGFIIESYCDAPWMSLTLSGHSGLGVIRVICRMTQDTGVTSTQSANMFHPFAQVLG